MKILILGVNGFIGHHLTRRALQESDWEIFGMDLGDDRVKSFLGHPRFHYVEGDIGISREWIEYHIKKCDVVLPLVAGDEAALWSFPRKLAEVDHTRDGLAHRLTPGRKACPVPDRARALPSRPLDRVHGPTRDVHAQHGPEIHRRRRRMRQRRSNRLNSHDITS